MAMKKRGLGKGLGALLQSAQVAAEIRELQQPETTEQPVSAEVKSVRDKMLREIPVEFIQRGKYQPRRDMSPEALEELSNSIKAQGVMQPIVVRPVDENRYEIIAGERRWRATQLAGLDRIPAVIREVSDESAIAMALIENIQREDLNPIEEALALSRLKEEFELTQQEVADAVGKSRVTVTNLLRLMTLQTDVMKMLEYGDIEMGHAKALLGLTGNDQLEAARTVVAKSLSVRQTEALVRRLQQQKESPAFEIKRVDPNIKTLEEDLSQRIGARVAIQHSAKGKGKLVISYNSLDELDGVLEHIK
ncbi:ParB/RepB/Spo0J family partition protein [Kistimonas asteriae]|uniref:ParB/RepB/Spo0J family partition protein n=1 Tax=Kistimonas asteriae TaxID=517724 RepID=UPI0031B8AEED